MDTKRLIFSVTLMLAVVIGWQLALKQIIKRHPSWAEQVNPAPTTAPVVASSAATTAPTTSPVAGILPAGLQAVGSPLATKAGAWLSRSNFSHGVDG